MFISRNFGFDAGSSTVNPYKGKYDEPSVCPLCKHALKPQELNLSTYADPSNNWYISALYLCNHCFKTFVTLHSCALHTSPSNSHSRSYTAKLLYTEPTRFEEQKFDDALADLSPQFVKIYNQALAAETSSLDEIAGLGYRKALEFLIKDFCSHLQPEDEDKIKKLPLSKCITEYINSPEIKGLASRAAWIGNDEAHYVRKFDDRDVSDMKKFIQAAVYFIGMVLITEDAQSMDPA